VLNYRKAVAVEKPSPVVQLSTFFEAMDQQMDQQTTSHKSFELLHRFPSILNCDPF
jgi:hypothetical protein